MKAFNYIFSLVSMCIAIYYLAIDDKEMAIWFGILGLNSLIHYGLEKIGDIIVKIDELKNK